MNKMCTLVTYVKIVTDHKQLVHIYNSSQKTTQVSVNSHCTKLLPFEYNVMYEPGNTTPCDYGSRHPPKKVFTPSKIEKWGIDEGNDIYVNRLSESHYQRPYH